MEAVVAAAGEHAVPIHRISQGSGVMLQTDEEIQRMVALGRAQGIEVCLFVGPRANWDVGVAGRDRVGARCSGRRCVAPISWPSESRTSGMPRRWALRSILVADIGQLHGARPDEESRRPAGRISC